MGGSMNTLIEELKDLRDRFRSSYEEMGDHDELVISATFDKAINIVKQHSDWIPVSERLPSDRGYFLVRLNTGEITVDYYDYDNGYWSKNYGNVTHFMRLPQPTSEVQP